MTNQSISIPITGMTCANCAANIHRQLKRIPGVLDSSVNFASESATVAYNPTALALEDIVETIHKAGFKVPLGKIELPVTGMTCVNCASNIERSLKRRLHGVVRARVNFAAERASVDYIPALISPEQLVETIREAGFDAVIPDGTDDGEDVEQAARLAEIKDQTRKFKVGLVCALPLFVLSMGRDFQLIGDWAAAPLVNWLFLALATPVQFFTGWDYYVGGLKSLKNKSANMDVLVAMGSSTAYFYSLIVMLIPALGSHVYFETSAVI